MTSSLARYESIGQSVSKFRDNLCAIQESFIRLQGIFT